MYVTCIHRYLRQYLGGMNKCLFTQDIKPTKDQTNTTHVQIGEPTGFTGVTYSNKSDG